jgi:hypothetical protein
MRSIVVRSNRRDCCAATSRSRIVSKVEHADVAHDEAGVITFAEIFG